jgi:hypothetical protein
LTISRGLIEVERISIYSIIAYNYNPTAVLNYPRDNKGISVWSWDYVYLLRVVLLKKLNEVIAGVMELDHLDAVAGIRNPGYLSSRVYRKSQN